MGTARTIAYGSCRTWCLCGALLTALCACGADESSPGPTTDGGGGLGGTGGAGGSGGTAVPSCDPGHTPGPDGDCMAVGVQGCVDLFIEDDGLCHPRLDKCPLGTIPKFDEGCVPVGIQDCADDFMQDDGLCHPAMAACPAGTFATPLEGCLPIDGEQGCGTGTWGLIADGPDTIWVDPSYQGGNGNGTQAEPLTTIADALAVVVDGGRIALAAGTYDEPVAIDQSIELVGRCPSMVTISGVQPTNLGAIPQCTYCGNQGQAIVLVQGSITAALRSLRLSGDGYGVIAAGATVTLSGLHIEETTGAGIIARGGADLTIERSLVEHTQPVATTSLGGDGLGIATGAQANLEHSTLYDNAHVGTYAIGAGSRLTALGALVDSTRPCASNGDHGYGIVATYGAEAVLQSSASVHNRATGVFANVESQITIQASLIDDTLPRGTDGLLGTGLAIQDQSSADIDGCVITGSHNHGIAVTVGSSMVASRTLVSDTVPSAGSVMARGLLVDAEATATFRDAAVIRSQGIGIELIDADGVLLEGSLVEANGKAEVGFYWNEAVGVGLLGAADGIIRNNALVANWGRGLALSASSANVEHNLIEATLSASHEQLAPGLGVSLYGGSSANLTANAVVHNHGYGMALGSDDQAEITVRQGLVSHTQPRAPDGEYGIGVSIDSGPVSLSEMVITDNHLAGLLVNGAPVTLSRTRIADTHEGSFTQLLCGSPDCPFNKQTIHHGVADGLLAIGATLDVDGVTIERCSRVGVLYHASEGLLTAVRSTQNGIGLAVQRSPQPVVDESCAITGNTEQDVLADSDLAVPDAPSEVPEL